MERIYILEWHQFWTIFQANVDCQEITKTEKFSYLLGLLRGSALETIRGLTISDNNYDIAVAILKERFERSKGSIIGRLYGELKRMPCSQKSTVNVRQNYNACEAILRQLKEAGEDVDSNTSLTFDILSKFPQPIISALYQRYDITDESNVSDIRRAILKCINDHESLSEKMSQL